MADTAASEPSEQKSDDVDNKPSELSEGLRESETFASDKPPEWVEWRESSDSLEDPPPSESDTANVSDVTQLPSLPNGELPVELEDQPDKTAASPASTDEPADSCKTESGESHEAKDSATDPSQPTEAATEANQSIEKVVDSHAGRDDSSGPVEEHEKVN